MKKRYIALGSVVMFLLLLRNKKSKPLTVEQVGPVIVHGEEEKKDVEIRVEAPAVTPVEKPVEKPVVSNTATTSNTGGISTTEVLTPVEKPAVTPVVTPVEKPAVSNVSTTSNAGGISTTAEVSPSDAIINKLDNLLADRSDDYTNWVRDEERKNRERNAGVSVGISTSSGSFE